MTRREFGLGFSALGIVGLAGLAHAQDRTPQSAGHHMPDEAMKACAKACSDCQRECTTCSTHCAQLIADNKKDHLATLMTCQDCADFCIAAASIAARGGPFAMLICQSCAEACARCGKECEKFPDDPTMQRCAQECRRCEKACNDMVKRS